MAQLITPIDSARVAANLERVRAAIAAATPAGRDAADVEVLAAVKYVALEELGALAEAGITLLGENRAQELERKAQAWEGRAAFRWDFIGHLQSRKVRQVLPRARLVHSVASDSVLRELGKHGTPDTEVLVEVNVAGDESKSGIAPADLDAFVERCPRARRGPHDDAAAGPAPGGQPPALRGARAAGRRPRPARAVDGHDAGLRGGGGRGRDDRAPRVGPAALTKRPQSTDACRIKPAKG